MSSRSGQCELYVVEELRAKHYNGEERPLTFSSAIAASKHHAKQAPLSSKKVTVVEPTTVETAQSRRRRQRATCTCNLHLKRRSRALAHAATSAVPRELQLRYLSGGRDTPYCTTLAALVALCLILCTLCISPSDALRHAGPIAGPVAAALGTLFLVPVCSVLLARAVIHTPLMNPWFSFCSSAVNELYALVANAHSTAATATLCAALVKLSTRHLGALIATAAAPSTSFIESSAQRAIFALHTLQKTHWLEPSVAPLAVALVACVVLPRLVVYRLLPRYTLVACLTGVIGLVVACLVSIDDFVPYPKHYTPLPHNLTEHFEGALMRSFAMPLVILSAWQALAHTFAHTKFARTSDNTAVDVMSVSIFLLCPLAAALMAFSGTLVAYTIQAHGDEAIQTHGVLAPFVFTQHNNGDRGKWIFFTVAAIVSTFAAPLATALLCAAQFRSHTRLAMENLTAPQPSTATWNGQSRVPYVGPLLRFALEFVVPLAVVCNEQVLLEASACASAFLVCSIGAAHHATQGRQVIFSAVLDTRPTFWQRNRTLFADALVVLCAALSSLLCSPSIVDASLFRSNLALYIALRCMCGVFGITALLATYVSWKTRHGRQMRYREGSGTLHFLTASTDTQQQESMSYDTNTYGARIPVTTPPTSNSSIFGMCARKIMRYCVCSGQASRTSDQLGIVPTLSSLLLIVLPAFVVHVRPAALILVLILCVYQVCIVGTITRCAMPNRPAKTRVQSMGYCPGMSSFAEQHHWKKGGLLAPL